MDQDIYYEYDVKENGERDKVTIIMLGDNCTGKSTIIKSHLCDKYIEYAPTKIHPTSEILDGTETLIIDTDSNNLESIEKLLSEINPNNAAIACIVMSVDNHDSCKHAITVWVDLVHKYQPNMPILMVLNKIDLIRGTNGYENNYLSSSSEDDEYFKVESKKFTDEDENRIIDEIIYNRQIERYVKCSAKTMDGIKELFSFAQTYAMFPGSKLFDLTSFEDDFNAKAIRSFKKVFSILDKNKDGWLESKEVDNIYIQYLNEHVEENVFESLRQEVEDSIEEGYEGELNLKGFIMLWKLFLKQSRFDVIWVLLRKFGYNDQLNRGNEEDLYINDDENDNNNSNVSLPIENDKSNEKESKKKQSKSVFILPALKFTKQYNELQKHFMSISKKVL